MSASLLCVMQGITDLRGFLENKANRLSRFGYQLQPHVVVLAQSEDWFSGTGTYAVYTCVHSSMYYEATSVLEAVDIAFKSCFVLGLQYPAAAHTTWSFVQKAVFGITHRFDRIPSKVTELMSDLKK